ncbi:MAG: hypothetical protein E7514_02595 [Ruminococcaceae bacterium]|nr:hypothetical protein [Oscillospiraceae bacterium]
MTETANIHELTEKLFTVRRKLLDDYPFYGRLLMRLKLAFDECGTAYTDMEYIVFDPSFISSFNEEQLTFLMMHELMHCILKHCTRSCGKINEIYNIACDIVVNSLVLDAMGLDDILINGIAAMHTLSDGTEGKLKTADEIYNSLIGNDSKSKDKNNGKGKGNGKGKNSGQDPGKSDKKSDNDDGNDGNSGEAGNIAGGCIDSHDAWEHIKQQASHLEELWNKAVCDAADMTAASCGSIPANMKRVICEIRHSSLVDWRHVLRSHITSDRYDFDFSRPDRRYDGDIILPSFRENIYGQKIENIWIAVDTSGSVSKELLSEFMFEIKDVIYQIGNVSGFVSFFDSAITEPVPISSDDEPQLEPVGGGGTDFFQIFGLLKTFFPDELPKVVIIFTDGYAEFPEEKDALGTDVIWVIAESGIVAPWGETIPIETIKEGDF